MKTLKKYKGKLTEWIVFTFIFFFLYDIIWAVADFEDFKQSIDGYYICLFVDLVYCAIFLVSACQSLNYCLDKDSSNWQKKNVAYFFVV